MPQFEQFSREGSEEGEALSGESELPVQVHHHLSMFTLLHFGTMCENTKTCAPEIQKDFS
jgi:hypothetical protein